MFRHHTHTDDFETAGCIAQKAGSPTPSTVLISQRGLNLIKAKFHQSSRSKTWSQTCVTCTSGSQTSRKHVESMSRTRSKTVSCWRHKWRVWPDLYSHDRLGRKRARSITCWDRSSTLSTRFSTRKVLSLSWAGCRPGLAGRKPGRKPGFSTRLSKFRPARPMEFGLKLALMDQPTIPAGRQWQQLCWQSGNRVYC